MENEERLKSEIGQRLARRYVVEFLSTVLGSLYRVAHVVSVPAGEKVNSGQRMCYQRGISLNREILFAGQPHWNPYAVLTLHRVEKCGSHAGQVISILLLNEMQSETLTGSTRQKRGSKSWLYAESVPVGPDLSPGKVVVF
jgi:hypothetical protein